MRLLMSQELSLVLTHEMLEGQRQQWWRNFNVGRFLFFLFCVCICIFTCVFPMSSSSSFFLRVRRLYKLLQLHSPHDAIEITSTMRLLCLLLLALAVEAAPCDERKLERDAAEILAAHVDVELGGVGAGKRDVVGFQYLKPAEALLAAQAIAHEDFNQAAAQVQRILRYQKPDGLLPHLVYGPAFWQSVEQEEDLPLSSLNTSTVSAPPVAADVAWEIFRLAPYDSVLGVRTTAVQFLCSVYEPLKKLHKYLFSTRRGPAPEGLLTARSDIFC
uniref:Mannosylglycerate hydrolase MGH1-like glycoside hydrolase domain-containing protein n=1 Tax=Phytophthora ramorum TaxID=164328 RepID=H3GWT8_PHYRM